MAGDDAAATAAAPPPAAPPPATPVDGPDVKAAPAGADGASAAAAGAAPAAPADPAAAAAAAKAAADARAADDATLAAGVRARLSRAAAAHAFRRAAPEPPREADHWDYVLREGAWMFADFQGERAWKAAAGRALAAAAAAVDWPATLTATDAGAVYRADAAAHWAEHGPQAASTGAPSTTKKSAPARRSAAGDAAAPGPATPPRLTYAPPTDVGARLDAAHEAARLDRQVAALSAAQSWGDDLARARRAAAAAAAAARAAADAEADSLRMAPGGRARGARRGTLSHADSGRFSDADSRPRRTRRAGDDDDDDDLRLAPRPRPLPRAADPRRGGARPPARAARPGLAGRPAGPGPGTPWAPADEVLLCAVVHEFGSNWALAGDVLTSSAALRGLVRPPAACRARFRALTHPGDPAAGDVSAEGAHAAASITKAAARELLARALPVPDAALASAARAAGAAFAAARARRAAEERRAREAVAARGAPHPSHAAVADAALASLGGVPPTPATLVEAAEAAAARASAAAAAAPGPAAGAAAAPAPPPVAPPAPSTGSAAPRHSVTVAQVQDILRLGRLPDGRELTAQLRAALAQRVRAAQAAVSPPPPPPAAAG